MIVKSRLRSRSLLTVLFCGLLLVLPVCLRASRDTIRHGDLNYNAVEIFGDTPALELARAAASGDTRAIHRLIASGVSPNTVGRHDITPLWWAAWAENYEGFSALLGKAANPNYVRKVEGDSISIMHSIIYIADTRYLKAALQRGGNPNLRNAAPNCTPLFTALLVGDGRAHLDLLLNAGADLNAQDGNGYTPAMMAIAARGDYHLVWEFLQRGADWTPKNTIGKGATLAEMIEARAIYPDGDSYIWREKVMEFLRSKGVPVHRPAHESPRTKSL